jgi:hypothetical protein
MEDPYTKTLAEFEEAVEQSDSVNKDLHLKGAPTDVTVGTLIEYGHSEKPNMNIYVQSNRPYPLSIGVTLTELGELPKLIKAFGTSCLTAVDENEDGTIDIGYRFD